MHIPLTHAKSLFKAFTEHQPSTLSKKLGLGKNKSAKQIQGIYKSHLKTHIEDIEPDIPVLKLVIQEDTPSANTGYIIAELNDIQVYLKPIETQQDLNELAALQTLNEINSSYFI